MLEAKALLGFAAVLAACMLILALDWMRRAFIAWRERRDLRIRDRGRPQYDPRAARHRDFSVGRDVR